jgi:hypothetical protein
MNDIALYLYLGVEGLFLLLKQLPWPSMGDIFGSFTIFLILWYPRYKLERLAKARYRHDHKRQTAPTTKDHQAAASSVSNLFTHH